MFRSPMSWLGVALGLLCTGPGPAIAQGDRGGPPAEPPLAGRPADAPTVFEDDDLPAAVAPGGPAHEAIAGRAASGEATWVATPPPAARDEPITAERPGPAARWAPGYWDWDAARSSYSWVAGLWVAAPPGRHWIEGAWKLDQQGYYRVPGSWGDREEARTGPRGREPIADGPPREPGPPPGPDYFYVQGGYEPAGDNVVWKPGFWAKAQPGWTWTPGNWALREGRWAYQAGRWVASESDRQVEATSYQPGDREPGGPEIGVPGAPRQGGERPSATRGPGGMPTLPDGSLPAGEGPAFAQSTGASDAFGQPTIGRDPQPGMAGPVARPPQGPARSSVAADGIVDWQAPPYAAPGASYYGPAGPVPPVYGPRAGAPPGPVVRPRPTGRPVGNLLNRLGIGRRGGRR